MSQASQAVLGDRYRLGEPIADGGMGSVYRAVDESLGRHVAVKVLRRELAAAHAHGLVHRDVKPGNVLVDAAGRAKVTDFGIAKAAASPPLTRTGMVVGSANYVAPEQAKGDDVGPAADQYSLGCLLYEAVTGSPPYRGASAVAIAAQHVSAPVPDPRRPRPDLPVAAGDLIRRALAKTPEDRFASAAAMADTLAASVAARDPRGAAHPDPPLGASHPDPPPGASHPDPTPGAAYLDPTPGASHPNPPKAGAPAREASPQLGGAREAVHNPPGCPPCPACSAVPSAGAAVGAVVVTAPVLLAWPPRGGYLDPPAGQSERPPPTSLATVPEDDD